MGQASAAVLLVALCCASAVHAYVAAVSNHVAVEGSSPRETLDMNMDIYALHIQAAAEAGAEILVLPEFGLGGNFESRDTLYPYLENIPGLNTTGAPCDHPENASFPISARVSCLARQFNITVAIELYDLKVCDGAVDPNCPQDGRYQYNTELVIDNYGLVLSKYYKTHEWIPLLAAIDEPVDQPLITFVGPGGCTFGIFMCFDIAFVEPAIELVRAGVKHFVYSVAMNAAVGKAVHSTWSRLNGVVLLASNIGQEYSGIHDAGEELFSERVSIRGVAADSIFIAEVPNY